MAENCGDWLDLLKSYLYYAHQICVIYLVLAYSVDVKGHVELWNPLSKTVLNKCSFIWNRQDVNISNDRKVQK